MGKGWIRSTVAGLVMTGVGLGVGVQAAGAEPVPTSSYLSVERTVSPRVVGPINPKWIGPLSPSTMTDRMTAMVNKVRAQGRNCGSKGYFPPAPPLVADARLTKAAQAHSADMATNDFMSHDGSNGSEPEDRITAAGYSFTAWAENVAAGQPSEQAVIDAWFASPGHCANFMEAHLKHVGFGRGTNANSTYQNYWTADLGRP